MEKQLKLKNENINRCKWEKSKLKEI